jgi:hypothetical protein
VGGFKKVSLFAQDRACRLILRARNVVMVMAAMLTRQRIRRDRGLAVLHHIAQDGQRNAGETDEENAGPLKESSGHQNDNDVEHRDAMPSGVNVSITKTAIANNTAASGRSGDVVSPVRRTLSFMTH